MPADYGSPQPLSYRQSETGHWWRMQFSHKEAVRPDTRGKWKGSESVEKKRRKNISAVLVCKEWGREERGIGNLHSACARRKRALRTRRLDSQWITGGQKVTFINLWIRWHSLRCLLSKTTDTNKGAGRDRVSASPLSFWDRKPNEDRMAKEKHWSQDTRLQDVLENWSRCVCVCVSKYHLPSHRSTQAPFYIVAFTWTSNQQHQLGTVSVLL